MGIYGSIRTSRDQETGHSAAPPEVQRRPVIDAGVEPRRIYADIAVSGAKVGSLRDHWHHLNQQLA